MTAVSSTIKVNDKKTINGWAIYDWANSAYFLVISTAIFPAYFLSNTPEIVSLLGMEMTNSSLYSYAVSFSYIVIVLLSPLLSGIADFGNKRMYFLKLFTIFGSLACIALYFFAGVGQMWLGVTAFILATIGCAGGIVFYNAYLPEIVTEDRFDAVSAKGYSFGYIGSVLLLVMILVLAMKPDWFGITSETLPYRIGFVMVGLWWIGFAQITFKRLPGSGLGKITKEMMSKGVGEIKGVYQKLKQQPNILRFLTSFFFYSAGVQTVIYLASAFGSKELGFDTINLITVILILQFLAMIGAYLFAQVSKRIGNKWALIIMNTIWIAICFAAFFVVSHMQFYVIAGFVGLVMGGIQSLSRSTYSKMVDENKEDLTSYFSFYDIVYKLSVVVGTFVFGLIEHLTSNMRYSILGLAIFFIIGILLLTTVKVKFKAA
ncbi:MFS transporter [Portibacter lacus]|uniref:MFS transporter n=1 Tax=Portibacter lacus TaxID=1099794 RepID=A0AA37WE06_9BACT|nr:MFS transporter [Portibacter lacus]GLR17473.1 MFS transporter [Portibacter lacus]